MASRRYSRQIFTGFSVLIDSILCKNVRMAMSPVAPAPGATARPTIFGKAKLIAIIVLAILVVLCLAFSWNTRSALGNRSFSGRGLGAGNLFGKKTLVDVTPWQTAQTVAALAVSAEETEYAHDAERLADHEVDQAFASALRQARLQSEHLSLSGEAKATTQKIANLQQLIAQDRALVQSLTQTAPATLLGKTSPPPAADNSDDLEVAKAQLNLDSDELADAQRDLDRAVGDDSSQIQEELTAREAAMQRFEKSSTQKGQIAALSVRQHSTLAGRIRAWFNQIERYNLLQQAQQQAQQDIAAFTSQHNALEAQTNSASSASVDRTAKLAMLKDRSTERQILSIYDDRIQTEQQLAAIYAKWSAQVLLQHNIVFQLILQSFAVILLIVIGMLLCDTLVRKLLANPRLDRRQTQTLRSILQLGVQVVGVVLILLVIFGVPKETPTILGLTTAALTVALQDFILAFLGWFVLVGKHGMHVGDWVEINGVGGEVTEVGLFSTSLLETGKLEDKGHPTGRRITFMNSFAIRGTYFNFSTSGQWMWDEISVTIPSSEDTGEIVEKIQAAVLQETEVNTQLAEQEWKRSSHGIDLTRFSAAPVVNLRPSSSGIGAQIRYVTRASQRFELSNRIYQRVIDVLQHASGPAKTDETHAIATS